jgi:hypothetical protein
MATGDVPDVEQRLRATLPPWFPNQGSAPVIDAILVGIATLLSNVYALISFAQAQTRIRSATGAFIDLIAWDFFGGRFTRLPSEIDAPFLARLLKELIRPRVTRAAISAGLKDLTGYTPRIIETWLPSDVGVIDGMYIDVDTKANPGRIGEPGLSAQFFVETVLPLTQVFGNNTMPAIDVNLFIDQPPTGYIMDVNSVSPLGAAAAYNLINAMRAAGITCWVRFVSYPTAFTWDEPGIAWDQPGVTFDAPGAPN